MSNLLPGEEKNILQREYAFRRAVIGLVYLASIFVFASLLLAPTRIVLLLRERQIKEELSMKQMKQDRQKNESSAMVIRQTKEKLAALNENGSGREIHPVLERIIGERGTDISITAISYGRGADAGSAVLEGVAPTRRHLIAFKRALESLDGVEKVDLPISDLTKDEDLDFSLTVTGAFNL